MKKQSEHPVIKGYKVFLPDFKAKEKGFQYAENTQFIHEGPISICNSGFHFCVKASHCFSYYDFNPTNIVCEVESRGQTQNHAEDSKICTNILYVGRRLSWEEVLVLANEGKGNSGHSNSGDRNSGNWNSGNSNSGYRNSGDSNSGNWNSGDRNSGNSNSGYRNSGDRNSGNSNSGYRNSGDSNSGNWNSGDSNSGYRNSGYRNSGDRNSGNWNSGDRNSGDSNSGDRNSGNWNSGDRNSGDSNSGYRNSGAFCLDPNPVLYLFDKPTTIRVKEWEQSPVCQLMYNIDTTIWVPMSIMTEEEKKAHPKYETTVGYLKSITMKEAWANMWHNLSDENKTLFTTLPNFDASMFETITGIKIL